MIEKHKEKKSDIPVIKPNIIREEKNGKPCVIIKVPTQKVRIKKS